MKKVRDGNQKRRNREDRSNGKPPKEKIDQVAKRLFSEYSEAWEELADH